MADPNAHTVVALSINKSELVNITVSRAPKILDQSEKLNYPEGTNATFMCSIGSGELDGLTYEWLKDEKRLVPSARHRISIAPENFNSILRVIDLEPDDSGAYSCVARNSFGKDRITIRLQVKGECFVHVPSSGPHLHCAHMQQFTDHFSPRSSSTKVDLRARGQSQGASGQALARALRGRRPAGPQNRLGQSGRRCADANCGPRASIQCSQPE